jgi:hypothetical protein
MFPLHVSLIPFTSGFFPFGVLRHIFVFLHDLLIVASRRSRRSPCRRRRPPADVTRISWFHFASTSWARLVCLSLRFSCRIWRVSVRTLRIFRRATYPSGTEGAKAAPSAFPHRARGFAARSRPHALSARRPALYVGPLASPRPPSSPFARFGPGPSSPAAPSSKQLGPTLGLNSVCVCAR